MRKQKFGTSWQVGAGFVALSLLAGHWFPWSYFLAGRPLPRIGAYIYGSLMVLSGFSLWRHFNDNDDLTPTGLAGLYLVGFAATTSAYLVDEAAKISAHKTIQK